MNLQLIDIKGIGEKYSKKLSKLGIEDVKDLITYLPRDYEKFEEPIFISDCKEGKIVSIEAIVTARPVFVSRDRCLLTCVVEDKSGKIRINWFNSTFIIKKVLLGRRYVFRGQVYKKGNVFILNQPRVYEIEKYKELENMILPIYHITEGLKNNSIRKFVKETFDRIIDIYKDRYLYKTNKDKLDYDDSIKVIIEDFLPKDLLEKNNLMDLSKAYYHIHFPKNYDDMISSRRRLIYNEFLLYELGIFVFQNDNKKVGIKDLSNGKRNFVNKVIKNLNFTLTDSQNDILQSVLKSFDDNKHINMLIQGDVGSGKTIIAFLVLLYVAENNFQVTFMAPTEVLAYQHYQNFLELVNTNEININVAFLSGSTSLKEKNRIKSDLKDGKINVLIGTHAVLTNDVVFKNLGLAIIDEQQKFGVNQRRLLEEKGNNINMIQLSATPIPRTLYILLFGEMEVQKIKSLPNGRKYIKTAIIGKEDRDKAYRLMQKEISIGNKCYMICPIIEEEIDEDIEKSNLENVKDYKNKLIKYLKDNQINVIDFNNDYKKYDDKKKCVVISFLHGKMKQKEKDLIIQYFNDGYIDILVSTTVVEVGIDNKNATFIMIENAEYYGLSTLHQLRGRVGRSDKQSFCIFVDTLQSEKSQERLKVLYDSNDGFYIADKDLEFRGAGDLFGIRQSGELGFKIGNIYQDKEILNETMITAKSILKDNKMDTKEYENLKIILNDYVKNGCVL